MESPMIKPQMYRTPFVVGLPVMPQQFFGRQEQVERFFGQCIFGPVLQPARILGLRRSGKTSFLNYVSDRNIRNRFLTQQELATIKFAYINAQTVRSRNEFYTVVADAIQDQFENASPDSLEFKSSRAFEKWLDVILQKDKRLKIIVLIDEFEKLNETEDCDIEFFGFLRALASARQSSFTWVTASAVDLYTLDKKQKTSPFWNIFHQMPIIMGSFRREEAEALITDSLRTVDSTISKNEINDIIALSGRIPYFIQAVADAWHKLKSHQSLPTSKMKRAILEMLSNPGNQIQHIYRDYWEEMSKHRRMILKNIAGERRNISASYYDLLALSDYGLIESDDDQYGGYTISGELLKQFLVDMDTAGLTPSSAIQVDMHGGTFIGGDVQTEGGSFIGRDQIHSGIDGQQLFALIYNTIDKRRDLTDTDRADLRQDVDELKQELTRQEQADESFLMRRLRNIRKMAPDVLEVTLATITNPAAGFDVIARKIAERIKVGAD